MDFTTTLANLQTLLNSKIALLQTVISAQTLNGAKPSYSISSPEGSRTISWNEYYNELNNEIKDLTDTIQKLIDMQQSLNPYELRTQHL